MPNGSSIAEYRLPHDKTAAARARSKIEDELTSVLAPLRIEDSRLMVTELVSNAIRHAPPQPDGNIVLEIEREPGLVRIVVRDGGKHMDLNGPIFHPQADGHYGLSAVDALADQWGFSIDGDKGVWFEVETG
jgi:anti-sigma regulatory factor (Ser/Thr protein kinase)